MLIQEYGLFWRADQVDWFPRAAGLRRGAQPDGVPRFALLGRQGQRGDALRVADFFDQRGIYILYGNYGPHYVGLNAKRGLAARLKEHMKDGHAGQWDRFSWFGFRRALEGRDRNGLSVLGAATSLKQVDKQRMIREMEALLIHAMGLTNIRRTRFPEGAEWTQVLNVERELFLDRAATRPGPRSVQRRRRARWA